MEQAPLKPNNLSNDTLKVKKIKHKKETLNGDFLNDLGVSGFDEFTEKYYKTILATSLRQLRKYNSKNSTSDAEDITQEIIIKLMNPKYLDKYKASTKEGKTLNAINWLKVLTTNYTIDFLRKKNRDKADLSLENEDGEPFSHATQSLDPLDELLVKESQEQRANLAKEVEDEIDILPQKLKQTIKLFKNGHNYSEISKQLNIPEGTVKSTIFRAKEILRKKLTIKGYEVGEKGAINRKS